ncbi:HlyD family efflux transporter periplasmic adaptor subunit [Blastopirellula sp. JC732]|uniref:HlyD family efflux transporter periplasmic adaptor subunit n=1 Tax=Blastopirellula sediminis TaxID=2894196 RepID=A0A9X1MR86_9BACT|nr:HlyD family efflux transporter periplasmic adaptor subunit [Blastopirellula sediminis]MCC9605723.1 HlyD family efflux transporter periplasmic adaptor subunit [Blastopirellula sediminis]MCC9630977.1 HlyD family efflux transporter periplasmic adaptor subunit [Blastopirellula sediminis]
MGASLNVRIRPDLKIVRQQGTLEPRFVVKDPVTLRYFYFGEHEMFILRRLDGQMSVAEIQDAYQEEYAPLKIRPVEITSFCHSLHARGLAIAGVTGQSKQLLERAEQQRLWRWSTAPLSVLSIRLPGVDPDRALDAIAPYFAWLFHRTTVMTVLVIASALMLMGLLHVEEILQRMPTVQSLFQGENLLWMALALAMVKILHELGHALACKHFGGECHQIGVMLLAFVPCMYCDVSDAWLLPDRKRRMFVSAAGMYVELIVASFCAVLWYFSEPGIVQSICFSVMLVASVSTLLVNGNPLMRYDGYYIFADWVDVPNLSQQASEAIQRPLVRFFTRQELNEAPLDANPRFLRTYGIAALVYRTMVIGFLVWFVYKMLKANDLAPLGDTVVVLVVAGLLFQPAIGLFRWWNRPMAMREIRGKRLAIAAVVISALLLGASQIRWAARVQSPVLAQLADSQRIYVPVEGRIESTVAAGDHVIAGETLAQLVNDDIQLRRVELTGDLNEQRQHVENLHRQVNNDRTVAAQIPAAEAVLADLQRQLDVVSRDAERLTIKAPSDGVVLPPPLRVEAGQSQRQLPTWKGTPLEEKNRGALMQRGDLLAIVAESDRIEAQLLIHQRDVDLVNVGDNVELLFDGLTGAAVRGRIVEISRDEIVDAPRNLAQGAELPVEEGEAGEMSLVERSYQATVELESVPTKLLPGTRGKAVVLGRSLSLGQRISRWISGNFRFEL